MVTTKKISDLEKKIGKSEEMEIREVSQEVFNRVLKEKIEEYQRGTQLTKEDKYYLIRYH